MPLPSNAYRQYAFMVIDESPDVGLGETLSGKVDITLMNFGNMIFLKIIGQNAKVALFICELLQVLKLMEKAMYFFALQDIMLI